MRLRQLFELDRTGEGSTAVVGWGRGMGHKGHMMLARSVITYADKLNGDPYFVVSRTYGPDDPLQPEEKLAIYKQVFPEQGHIFQTATDELPDLTRVLSNLNQQGYNNVTVVVGADQKQAFQYVKQYNGKPNKAGDIPFKFDNLDVISRQETGDPSASEEGPRATPMRTVLTDLDKFKKDNPELMAQFKGVADAELPFAVWRDAMNPEIDDAQVMDLMRKAKERMGQFAAAKPKKKAKESLSSANVRSIQATLNKKGANLDIDGKLGPLTKKSIKKFLPQVKTGLAPEPNKTTAVQGKKVKEMRLYELEQPSGTLYIIFKLNPRTEQVNVIGDFATFPEEVVQRSQNVGIRDKKGGKGRPLRVNFQFQDASSALGELEDAIRDVDFIGGEAAELVFPLSAMRSEFGEELHELKSLIAGGADERFKLYKGKDAGSEPDTKPKGVDHFVVGPDGKRRRVPIPGKPNSQMGGQAVAQPNVFRYKLLATELMPKLRDMGYKFDNGMIVLRADQRDKLKGMLGDKFGQVFGSKDMFKQ